MNKSAIGTIMVTGAEGFIGKALSRRLELAGHKVLRSSKRLGQDLLRPDALDGFLKERVDTVFHLAGKAFVPDSWKDPSGFYALNVLGTEHALEFCRKSGARMIYCSSYVYGIPRFLPVSEEHPIAPANPYAHSKWLAEELCRFYAANFGVDSAVLRPFNIYGPGQDERFLPAQLVTQAVRSGRVQVQDLAPRRDYLYLEDFVEGCLAVLAARPRGFSIFNLGSGSSASVSEVIEALERSLGREILIESNNTPRPNEIPDVVAACSLVQSGKWRPTTSLEQGLRNMIGALG